MSVNPVIIIGAGLAGLTAAQALHAAGWPVLVLEARARVGGRTLAVPAAPSGPEVDGLDLGATWGWSHHSYLMKLLAHLQLESFAQYSTGAMAYETRQGLHRLPAPASSAPYLRLPGGAAALCVALAQMLPAGSVQLSTRVTQVSQLPEQEGVEIIAEQAGQPRRYHGSAIVVAMPPRLVAHSISFSPPLPAVLQQTLRAVPTWMSHAMKSVVVYPDPFWRAQGQSGFAVSELGPLAEIHDASPASGQLGALFGFFAPEHPLRIAPLAERQGAVLAQLTRLFGDAASEPLAYHELDWALEPFTSTPGDEQPPRQVPLQGPALLRQAHWDGRLHWAGAETSLSEWGRLDGAVESGWWAAQQVQQAHAAFQSNASALPASALLAAVSNSAPHTSD
jgi:monoamine oxidase